MAVVLILNAAHTPLASAWPRSYDGKAEIKASPSLPPDRGAEVKVTGSTQRPGGRGLCQGRCYKADAKILASRLRQTPKFCYWSQGKP